jgi:fatty-acyl-CoA synthase
MSTLSGSARLSYAHGVGATPLLGQTIGDNLRATVGKYARHEALVVRSQAFRATYGELWDLTTRVARGLLKRGVQKGDRVGIWSPNRYEWPVVQYATARIGAILVNINPSYRAFELEFALNLSGVSVLALARGYRQLEYGPMLDEVRSRCPVLRHVIQLDRDWENLLEDGDTITDADLAAREATLNFDDPINIQYTSGTTGRPKGATLTHHNILNNGLFVGLALRYTEQDRVCIPVPFYHCFGMVLGCLACTSHGACMVVPGEGFDPRTVLEAVHAERCTSLYGVPTMFTAVLEHPRFNDFRVSSLRTGIMAGAPCPIDLMRRVVTDLHMPEVAIGYGMTELSPIATFTADDDSLDCRVGSVGRVLAHVEAKVVDPSTGQVVPRNTSGEFCARGYGVMRGYWNDDAASGASIDAGGWMHSGDLATMDDDGYFHIVGRIKDMIIRGGENISPREIEDYLLTHRGVSDAQVIGVPSRKYGEEIMAWVKPKPGAELTREVLTAYCSGRIAAFKVPRYWKITVEFPLTVTGKVQKFRMREIAIRELGLESEADIKTA